MDNCNTLGAQEMTDKEKIAHLQKTTSDLWSKFWELDNLMKQHMHTKDGKAVVPIDRIRP